jgi:hypothetical protein
VEGGIDVGRIFVVADEEQRRDPGGGTGTEGMGIDAVGNDLDRQGGVQAEEFLTVAARDDNGARVRGEHEGLVAAGGEELKNLTPRPPLHTMAGVVAGTAKVEGVAFVGGDDGGTASERAGEFVDLDAAEKVYGVVGGAGEGGLDGLPHEG